MSTKHVFPSYTRLEHIADACVHAVSVLFSIAAAALLLIGAIETLPAAIFIGLIVYSVGLVSTFVASAAYNLVPHHGLKEILRRLDHAAIFVMIAGSYTPFALVVGGAAGHAMLLAVWAIAAAGVAMVLRFPRWFGKLSVLLYLSRGWIVLLALNSIVASLPSQAFVMLARGRHCLHARRRFPSHGAVALRQRNLAHLRSRRRSLPVHCGQSRRHASAREVGFKWRGSHGRRRFSQADTQKVLWVWRRQSAHTHCRSSGGQNARARPSELSLASLPPEIGRLTALQELYLSFNQLTNLRPEIGRLTALQKLDLSGNQLTSLPPEIGRLTALQELDLSANQLTSLPPEIGRLTAPRARSPVPDPARR